MNDAEGKATRDKTTYFLYFLVFIYQNFTLITTTITTSSKKNTHCLAETC